MYYCNNVIVFLFHLKSRKIIKLSRYKVYCMLNVLKPKYNEEGSIEGPSTKQNSYKTELVNKYIVSNILGSFWCFSPPSDSILPNNVFLYSLLSRNPVILSISVNLSQGLLLRSVENCT